MSNKPTFLVYHPLDGQLNTLCEKNKYDYRMIGAVEAYDLQEAFKMTQNDFNEDYSILGHRSTSVGDVLIQIINDNDFIIHLVKPIGFEQIDLNWLIKH